MKTNWKRKVDEINRRRYTVPEGWETRDQVAESLECSPDRVDKLLKPGIDDGTFERKLFSVWDEARRMTIQIPCYRMTDHKTPATKAQPPTNRFDDRIRASILRNPGYSDYQIAKNIKGAVIADVARVRKSMS